MLTYIGEYINKKIKKIDDIIESKSKALCEISD